jgi:hypothetical protein
MIPKLIDWNIEYMHKSSVCTSTLLRFVSNGIFFCMAGSLTCKVFLLSSFTARMPHVTFRHCIVSRIFQRFCVVWVQIVKTTVSGIKFIVSRWLFLDVALCGLVEIDWCFRGVFCLHYRSDDRGSKHLSNVGHFLWDYPV